MVAVGMAEMPRVADSRAETVRRRAPVSPLDPVRAVDGRAMSRRAKASPDARAASRAPRVDAGTAATDPGAGMAATDRGDALAVRRVRRRRHRRNKQVDTRQ